MLVLYDVNHAKIEGLTNYKELKIDKELNIENTLYFQYPISDTKYPSIVEECYIRTDENEYVVKEINFVDDNWAEFVCKLNIEDLKENIISHFEAIEQTCTNAVNLALVDTGWTIGSCNVTKVRTVKQSACSTHGVLKEIQSAFGCEMTFNTLDKEVDIYQSMGSDKGAYFAEELNLKNLKIQKNSYDFITRLVPVGKDGLTIASVNGGLIYLENHQYSNKVITKFWEDNRYTIAQSLYDDAVAKLAILSKPYRAYSADVVDLATVHEKDQPLTNILQNGRFINGTVGWIGVNSSISAANNVLSSTGTGVNSIVQVNNVGVGRSTGKKYYGRCFVRVTNNECASLKLIVAGGLQEVINAPTANMWYELSGAYTCMSDDTKVIAIQHTYATSAIANGKVAEIKYVLAFDLSSSGVYNSYSLSELDAFLVLTFGIDAWFDGTYVKYGVLDYGLGDTITLLAKSKNTKEKQRIVKLTSYPDEPERNTCEIANKTLSLEDSQVRHEDTSMLVDTITTSDGFVDGAKIDAVEWDVIDNISIGTTDIQDAAITEAKIGSLAVTAAKIASAAIETAKIKDAAVTNAKIDRASVNKLVVETADIKDAAITNAKIDRASVNKLVVDTADIAAAAIETAQINDAAVTNAKIDRASINKLVVTDADIEDASINAAKIALATITNALIANATIETAQIALGAITTALINVGAVGTMQIADSSITDAKIVDLTASKLTAGTIDAGVITVLNLIADNITAGTLNGERIADASLINRMLAEGAVKNPNIFAGTITGEKLVAEAITSREIAAEAILANHIKAGEIVAAHLAAHTITAAQIDTATLLADLITAGTLRSVNGNISLGLDSEQFRLGLHLLDILSGALKFTSSQRTEIVDYVFKRDGGDMVNVDVEGTLRTTEAFQWGTKLRAEVRTDAGNAGVSFVF